MALPQTQGTIQKLFDEVKKNPQALMTAGLTPFLTSQKAAVGALNLSSTLKPTPHTPPKSPNDFGKFRPKWKE